jgi:hypothetical protein
MASIASMLDVPTTLEEAAALVKRNTSCAAGDNSARCQKSVGDSTNTIPIVLGIWFVSSSLYRWALTDYDEAFLLDLPQLRFSSSTADTSRDRELRTRTMLRKPWTSAPNTIMDSKKAPRAKRDPGCQVPWARNPEEDMARDCRWKWIWETHTYFLPPSPVPESRFTPSRDLFEATTMIPIVQSLRS